MSKLTSGIRRTAGALAAILAAALLLPQGALAQEMGTEAYEEARYEVEKDASLMAVLETNEEFGAFLRMVEAANLTDELADEGPYTLFVPTNEAFQGIDDWTVQGQARANERVRDIVLGHIVEGRLSGAELRKKSSISPLHRDVPGAIEPRAHAVDVRDGRVFLGGNIGAAVIESDLETANGVIHVIDAVLLEQNKGPQKTMIKDRPEETIPPLR